MGNCLWGSESSRAESNNLCVNGYVLRATDQIIGVPGIPPEFLAGVHQVDVYPVHNRGAATIVSQPRFPNSSHSHHVIKSNSPLPTSKSSSKCEKEKFLNRDGIIRELSALKAEVDQFQSLLESHHKPRLSPLHHNQSSEPLISSDSGIDKPTDEEAFPHRDPEDNSVGVATSTNSSSSRTNSPTVEGAGLSSASSSPLSGTSKEKRNHSITRNESFLTALHSLSEEKSDEVWRDEVIQDLNDDFYSHNSDSDDYTTSFGLHRASSGENEGEGKCEPTFLSQSKEEIPSPNPSISITPDVVPDDKEVREQRPAIKGFAGGSLTRSVAFDLSGPIDTEESTKKFIDTKSPKAKEMESLLQSPILPKFKIEEKGDEPSGLGTPGGILKKSGGLTANSSSEEAILRSFPSLPHSFLQQLGLHQTKGSPSSYLSTENLSDQDIENKFTSLSLAFKTDKLTLSNRLELQQRHRDTAERNIEEEIKDLKQAIGGLNRLCNDIETREVLQRLTQQVDVLRQSSSRVSSAAEVYGAVQQEARIARAIEVMLLHVDNLKRLYEKEHSELEETRRILADHNLSHHEKGRSTSGLPPPENLLDSSSKFVSLPSNDVVQSKSGRVRSVSVINNHSTESIEANPKLRRASYTALSSTQKSPETLSATNSSSSENNRPRSPTTSIMLHKGQANRKIGVISGGFRKTSHSRTLMGDNSVFSPIAEEGKEYELNGPKITTDVDNDLLNNNASVKIKKKVSLVEDPSHKARTKLYWRSKSTIETSLSSSMTSSSSNDEDTSLLDEIDQLAIKRDSSPNRSNLRLRHHLSSIRKKSIIQNVMDWYREFSWPWDWDETLLGLRYCLTGLLSFAAFISLVITFFGGGSPSIPNETKNPSSPTREEL